MTMCMERSYTPTGYPFADPAAYQGTSQNPQNTRCSAINASHPSTNTIIARIVLLLPVIAAAIISLQLPAATPVIVLLSVISVIINL